MNMPVAIKQWGVKSLAAELSKELSPAVPTRRYLYVQNTGANTGLMRFGGAVRLDGSDFLFAVGAAILFSTDTICPTEGVNFYSTGGTTWAVIEGVEGKNNG